MSRPYVLPLASCADPALVGGKASGLALLLRAGFRVPPGACLTTAVYEDTLRAAGFDPTRCWKRAQSLTGSERDRWLQECRRAIASLTVAPAALDVLHKELSQCVDKPDRIQWAVRSSATHEDTPHATFAGIYTTLLDVSLPNLAAAILDCWASLWAPAAFLYYERTKGRGTPAMAVVMQLMLSPRTAGVAYSRHPVTGQPDIVVVNAVEGLAEPLVSGNVIPDHVAIQTEPIPRIVERHRADPDRRPVLSDDDAIILAKQIRAIERAFAHPVDVEWAITGDEVWFLQARPIPAARTSTLTEHLCLWSRANFKETLPDVPSPLGLSFLHEFMERAILRHYRTLGCTIPAGLSCVRVIRGRPYINVSLFQHFMAQLSGDPDSITDQMGGEPHALPVRPKRLAWWRLLRAGLWMEWQIRRAARRAPGWFTKMKRMADEQTDAALRTQTPTQLFARMEQLGEQLYAGDLTFATVGGVSQGLYLMHVLLERRLGSEWRALMNAAMQGESRAISARQISWLMELAQAAGQEPPVHNFLLAEPWHPESFREQLAGTEFLERFDEYIAEYGHRAIGESDIMAQRFAEMPDYLLGIIRAHLQHPPSKSVDEMRHQQDLVRLAAVNRIRAAFGWRLHEWWVFCWGRRRLARYLALREANRHALMRFSVATRRLGLLIAEHLVARDVLSAPDDFFFLTSDELRELVQGTAKHWTALVAVRRAERRCNELLTVPDTMIGTAGAGDAQRSVSGALRGIPIGAGHAEGAVRLVRSPEDRAKVCAGDIVVVPVIDPGLAPLFGLAAGLIAEMGGTLSHGAIIAREYGLPAIANVGGVMGILKDGERVVLDATSGEIRRLP